MCRRWSERIGCCRCPLTKPRVLDWGPEHSAAKDQQQLVETGGLIGVPSVSQRINSSWRRQVGWLLYLQWVRGSAAVGGDRWGGGGDCGTFCESGDQQQLKETGGLTVVPSVSQGISSSWRRQVGWLWYLQWVRGSAVVGVDRWGDCSVCGGGGVLRC